MESLQKSTERKYYLDWLRVIAFYLLIFYHVSMIFVPWDFHIKNNITLEWFETWMAFLNQWRLPLLFMISGMVIFYSMGKRTGGQVVLERSKRLLIPLTFGIFIIVPPQIYFERISDGLVYANYFEFWKTVFDFVPFPLGGSLSWHHLWYILYIYVYSLVALPFFLFLRSERSESLKARTSDFINRNPLSIYLLIIPFMIFYFTLARKFPTTHALIDDWYNHCVSFSFFILGFLISAFSGLWNTIVEKRKLSLIIASVPAIILVLFVWGPTLELFDESQSSFIYYYGIMKWSFTICWLLAILGYSKFIFYKTNKFLKYANESVYPLYILHQSIMIIFGYYIIQLNWGVYTKFFVILIITFGGSFLFYELFIKRFNIMRLLFGMKPK